MWLKHAGILTGTSLMRTDGEVLVGYNGYNVRNPTGAADVSFVCWYSSVLDKYVVSKYESGSLSCPFDCIISVSGDDMSAYGVPVNGFPAWKGSTYCLFYGAYKTATGFSEGWIILPQAKMGFIPYVDSVDYDWWLYGGQGPHAATFDAKGTASAGVTTDTDNWPHWESDTMYGVYEAVNGASGTKIVGIPQYKDGNGVVYNRSLMQTGTSVNHHYSYGSAIWNNTFSGWVIGELGSASGWWQSAVEPNTSGATTFVFAVPEGSEVTGSNLVLTFYGYVEGTETPSTRTLLLGEAAIWRT